MSQTVVNFRLDENIKNSMDLVCKDIGLTMSAAFNIFAVKVAKEGKIPFELIGDSVYSIKNKEFIDKSIEKFERGDTFLRDLIED